VHDREKIDAVLSGRFRVMPQGENIVLGDEPVVSLDVIRIG